jgi:hypothetical protein
MVASRAAFVRAQLAKLLASGTHLSSLRARETRGLAFSIWSDRFLSQRTTNKEHIAMSSRSLNRKDFLVLTISSATIATFLEACGGDDPAPGNGTGGSGGTGMAGTGTAGTGTAGTGTAGTGTGGSTAGTGGSSAGTGTGGTSAGSGGTGGSGGSGGGSGGAGGSGGKGGSGGAGGSGGGGGGMCGTVSIMQTSAEQHDHIPADPTTLKADLKMHINGAMSTMAFTLPSDGGGQGHTHTLTFTVPEVMMLKGGGMITGKKSSTDETHSHTYTIGCGA